MFVDKHNMLRILIIMNTSPELKTIDAKELSSILKIKPRSLHARLARRPESLPRPIERGHGRKLIWLERDVEAWLKNGGSGQ